MAAVLIIAAAMVAGVAGYAVGRVRGRASRPADECRHLDRAVGAEQAARMWRDRALQLEEERDKDARTLTFTTELLLREIDAVTSAATSTMYRQGV